MDSFLLQFKDFIPNQTVFKHSSTKNNTHNPHAKLRCTWDNLTFHGHAAQIASARQSGDAPLLEQHEVPLYLSWLALWQSQVQEDMKRRHVSVVSLRQLTTQGGDRLRKTSLNKRQLEECIEHIVNSIKKSDIVIPMRCLLRERRRSNTNYSSIYREILYLVLVALERDKIDIGI